MGDPLLAVGVLTNSDRGPVRYCWLRFVADAVRSRTPRSATRCFEIRENPAEKSVVERVEQVAILVDETTNPLPMGIERLFFPFWLTH